MHKSQTLLPQIPEATAGQSAGPTAKAETRTTQVYSTGFTPWGVSSMTSTVLLVSILGASSLAFLLECWCLHKSGINDPKAAALFISVAPVAAFEWPVVAMAIAFVMNLLTLSYNRKSSKMPMVLSACYVNLMAGISHFLLWKELAPIIFDRYGQPYDITREVMWLHATPAMVYLLSTLADIPKRQIFLVLISDILMIVTGIAWEVTADPILAWTWFWISWAFWVHVMWMMSKMCDTMLDSDAPELTKDTVLQLRVVTMGVFTIVPIIKVLAVYGTFPLAIVPGIWGFQDCITKVIFTSSLVHGNFLTVEQRRLSTMRVVEDANKLLLIDELRTTMAQKERFMSGVSHELRTPLNGIIGLSDAMLAGSCGELTPPARKTVGTIKTSGARLLNLINDILDAASMKAGTLVVKYEPVNLEHVANDCVELCQPLCKRGVQLVSKLPANMPIVRGDSGRIVQILYNLIGNACKFTHKGTIAITGRPLPDDWAEVAVTDSGIGIPADKWDSIFNQFEQVDMSTTRKYGGTGLGLSLVKDLVEAHEGTITVSSVMGQGTTFTFTLKVWTRDMELPDLAAVANQTYGAAPVPMSPLSVGPEAAVTAAAAKADSSPTSPRGQGGAKDELAIVQLQQLAANKSGKLQVLSVDDDPINQMVMKNILNQAGYEVTTAMDGEEALEMLRNGEAAPDVILLDVMMPGMDGHEVCRRVRELYPDACVPIIMVSAKNLEESIVAGLQSGSNDYVTKPLRCHELIARIQTHHQFRQNCRASTGSLDMLAVASQSELNSVQKQLEEVSVEADRLQDEVDDLQKQLREACKRAEGAEASEAELAATRRKLEAVELELKYKDTEVASLKSQLVAAEDARVRAEALARVQAGRASGLSQESPSSMRSQQNHGSAEDLLSLNQMPKSAMMLSGQSEAVRLPLPGAAPAGKPGAGSARCMRRLLEHAGLATQAERFEEEEVTADLVPFLDETSLRCLGIKTLGARTRLRIMTQALLHSATSESNDM